mgnify:CR=1 FL=1
MPDTAWGMPNDQAHTHSHGQGAPAGEETKAGRPRAAHDHSHSHDNDQTSERRIGLAAILTGAFMGVEVAGGVIAGSLALIADAGHMLSDFASLALAWAGFRIGRRPADARRTFGFRRFSVLAAFVNGLALFAVAVWISVEAALRLTETREILAGPMLLIASIGLFVNIASFAILHGADRDNLNVRGALLHVAGDLLGSIAAIAAALIIMATGWTAADPILSVVVALIILRSAWTLVTESGHILLEGAPRAIDVDVVAKDLVANVEGVLDVHHAHAWSLDEKHALMTLHVRIGEIAFGPAIVARIKARLHEAHGIDHATVEIEIDDCGAGKDCA